MLSFFDYIRCEDYLRGGVPVGSHGDISYSPYSLSGFVLALTLADRLRPIMTDSFMYLLRFGFKLTTASDTVSNLCFIHLFIAIFPQALYIDTKTSEVVFISSWGYSLELYLSLFQLFPRCQIATL